MIFKGGRYIVGLAVMLGLKNLQSMPLKMLQFENWNKVETCYTWKTIESHFQLCMIESWCTREVLREEKKWKSSTHNGLVISW